MKLEVDSNHIFSLLQGRVQKGVLEQTDLSMRFHDFLWVFMRFYAHAPYRLQKIPIIGLFVSCFQKILSFYHVYNEPESPVILELTHFYRLHQYYLSF